MKKGILYGIIIFALCGCRDRVDRGDGRVPVQDDWIAVRSSVEVASDEQGAGQGGDQGDRQGASRAPIFNSTTFAQGDKVLLFAISRAGAGQGMPQSEVVDMANTNSFYWYKATGEYVSDPSNGSPFRVTGVTGAPNALLYSNAPGGYLDFYGCAPASVQADVSLKVLSETGSSGLFWPAYNSSKSLWVNLHNNPDVDGWDDGGWVSPGLGVKKTHVPIDYMYAVDGNLAGSSPILVKQKEPIAMRFKHAMSLVEVKIFRKPGSAKVTLSEVCLKPYQRANYIRITDGTIAAWSNAYGDGYYYRAPNLNYIIPEGSENALVLKEKFVVCPAVGVSIPSLAYTQDPYGCVSTMLTIDGAQKFVNFGSDKTVFRAGYKYTVSVAVGLKSVSATISAQPWLSESTQNITF